MPPKRTITEDNFGAWLIKCDPETKFDLPGLIEDGGTYVDRWSVVRSYRTDMMAEGDRVLLWVSGNGRRMAKGIWGAGHLTGTVADEVPSLVEAGDIGYWRDEEARRAVEAFVPLHIPLWSAPVGYRDILAEGLTDLEVFKVPQGSNPSWISREQLEVLDQLLPKWPGKPKKSETITVTTGGAGFGDPETNAVVEAAAMAAVIDFYAGWDVDDVSAQKVGWDLTFTHPATGEQALVEVKGVSGTHPTVLLTANELKAARKEVDWRLAVVTRALSAPNVVEYSAEEALAAAVPYVYKAAMPKH